MTDREIIEYLQSENSRLVRELITATDDNTRLINMLKGSTNPDAILGKAIYAIANFEPKPEDCDPQRHDSPYVEIAQHGRRTARKALQDLNYIYCITSTQMSKLWGEQSNQNSPTITPPIMR